MNDFVVYGGEDLLRILFPFKTDGCLGHNVQRYVAETENMTKILKSPTDPPPPVDTRGDRII